MDNRLKLYLLFMIVISMIAMRVPALHAQVNSVTFGLIQDSADPYQITAVAIPSFSSTNVTISSSVITILLPEGMTTAPAIPVLPSTGSFTDIEGVWTVSLLTPTVYASVGNDPADLQGRDIYQVTLQAGSTMPTTVAGQPIELFSFRLPDGCTNGAVEVMTNDGAIQQAIYTSLGANFNNQMAASIDDALAVEIYKGNNPALPCPLNRDFGDAPVSYGTLAADDGAAHTIHPNIQIGATVDQDSDGFGNGIDDIPVRDAADDDGEGAIPDDEDGVASFAALTVFDTSYSVNVTVTNNAGATAMLFGWIDFDGDGIFQTDEGTSTTVANSTISDTATLTWNNIGTTGPDISGSESYLRLRLTTDGAITTATPGGTASDGEVEDYQLFIEGDDPSEGNGPGPGDSDGDGVPNDVECPNGLPCPDADGDGVPDFIDPDSTGIALGDQVWQDTNGNGIHEADEPPLPGVTVTLFSTNTATIQTAAGLHSVVMTTTTDANGHYRLANLQPGRYYLEFSGTNGLVPTRANQGGDDALDSDAVQVGLTAAGRTQVLTLSAKQQQLNWDAGFTTPVSLTSIVYHDQNNDSVREEGEPLIANVTILLYDENNNVIARELSDHNGRYRFEEMSPGNYSIEVLATSGFRTAVEGRSLLTPLEPGDSEVAESPLTADSAEKPDSDSIYLPFIVN